MITCHARACTSRHAGFMDGIDLFDYRLFNISVREAELSGFSNLF